MSSKMNIAVIVAGGTGSRFGEKNPKQFFKVNGKQIIEYSINAFSSLEIIDKIVVVCHESFIKQMGKMFEANAKVSIIVGGKTRFHSSFNALKFIKKNEWINSNVLIHDAARPLISEEVIQNCIVELKKHPAITASMPVIETISVTSNNFIKAIPKRETLFTNQTPQCFWFDVIYESYKKAESKAENECFTDDVSVAIQRGIGIKVVQGSAINIKITTKDDIIKMKSLTVKS